MVEKVYKLENKVTANLHNIIRSPLKNWCDNDCNDSIDSLSSYASCDIIFVALH